MKKLVVALLFALNLALFAPAGSAEITLTGASYTETFDALGAGLPDGWSVRTNASATALGTEAPFTANTTSWGSSSGQFANFASTLSNDSTNFLGKESTTVQSNCLNRCLGVRQTAALGDPGAALVLQLANTRGLADFRLSLDLNMLSVQARSNAWTIDYGIGANPDQFTPVWTNSDPGVFGTTTAHISFGAALDERTENVWIRVAALEPSAGSGSRDTFGIDNVTLTYRASAVVASPPLSLQLVGTDAVVSWDNALPFSLQAAPSAAGVFTNIPGASSPFTNPIDGPQKFYRLKAN